MALPCFRKSKSASASQRDIFQPWVPFLSSRSTSRRVITTTAKTVVAMPIIRVVAKPRTGPVPKYLRIAAVRKVVTLESMIADRAFSKPSLAAWAGLRPFSASSRMRSKIRMLPSTAMPTVRMIPAMPGSVSVACSATIAPISSSRLAISAMQAKTPSRR